MSSKNASSPIIENIPEPSEIRERLSQALRETRLLRRLLKISEEAAANRARKAVANAG